MRLIKLIRNLVHRNSRDQDLDQEVRAYVDLLAAEKVAAGITPEAAHRQALIELGGFEQTKENVRGIQAGAVIWQVAMDVLHGFRILRRNPGFAAVAILSLALGIGVNSSAFSTMVSLVLHPFPFPQIDHVMTVWETTSKSAAPEPVSPANFFDWKSESTSFESMAASRDLDVTLTRSGEPERILAQQVTADFFHVLGIAPQAGRTFSPNEVEPGFSSVVVLSYSFWKTRLASAPDAVGRTLVLGQRNYSIAGIMPQNFNYPPETDVWIPLALTPGQRNARAERSLTVIGRLKPGVTASSASAEMRTIAQRLQVRYPAANDARSSRVIPLLEQNDETTTRFVWVLLGAAQFVLLLACANVANLLLARATARQKEIAVRSALGASRSRIARQLLAEVAVIGILAGAVGVLLGAWNLEHTRAAVPPLVYRFVPGIKLMRMDSASALLSMALSITSAFVCSIPALYQLLSRRNSVHRIDSRVAAPRSRIRSVIVVAESALALLLLVGAGLMVKTFRNMLTFDKGFDPARVLTMQVALPESRYATPDQVRGFYSRVIAGLSSLPASRFAAAAADLPSQSIRLEGHAQPLPGAPLAEIQAVSPAYFNVMKIPITQGREFTGSDGPDARQIVIISESVASRNWPQISPLGRSLQLAGEPSWYTVVGVSGDVKDWFTRAPQPTVYRPFAQAPQRAASLLLRTPGDPLAFSHSARGQVYQVDHTQPVFELDSMENVIAQRSSGVGAAARMMTIYALIALLLAPAGIYSLSSYLMAQRTREMGIRMALGAGRENILKLAILQSARLAGTGLAIGLVAAILLARWMSSILFDVVLVDWSTFVVVTVLLATCAFVAGYLPARRAARIDPMVALRQD